MIWLLTNDDGVAAPGLEALAQSLHSPGIQAPEALVVAPLGHHSGCGHQVTTGLPIQVKPLSDLPLCDRVGSVFGISGTPADCVRVARFHLEPRVTWVLSGINAGANLGADCYLSGTVAAVREAALHGIPGIAFSQYRWGALPIDWGQATQWAMQVLAQLQGQPLPPHSFWNVNFPHPDMTMIPPTIMFCPPSRQPLPVSFRVEGDSLHYEGAYAERQREPGSDIDVCLSGSIAITQLQV